MEASACWPLSQCDTELAQQCHCLAFHTTVCYNQKEKREMCQWGCCARSLRLDYENTAGPEDLNLGERRASRRSLQKPGGLWGGIESRLALLCNVNPRGNEAVIGGERSE